MFWLPEGLFPGWVEWFLAFPRAPRGSISLHVWGLACNSSIQYAQSVVDAIYQTTSTDMSTKGVKEKKMGFNSTIEKEKGHTSHNSKRIMMEPKVEL